MRAVIQHRYRGSEQLSDGELPAPVGGRSDGLVHARAPDRLSFAQAPALSASGGVDSYAVQIVTAYGAEVTGVASGATLRS